MVKRRAPKLVETKKDLNERIAAENASVDLFQDGDLVYAKITGFPHWPARVLFVKEKEEVEKQEEEKQEEEKQEEEKQEEEESMAPTYQIMYFGDHTVSDPVIAKEDLIVYSENSRKIYGKPSLSGMKSFKDALFEMEFCCTILPKDKICWPSVPGPSSGLRSNRLNENQFLEVAAAKQRKLN